MNPSDPIEFLARWLLHENKVRTLKKARRAREAELATEMAAFDKIDDVNKAKSAKVIQNHYRRYMEKVAEKERKVQELRSTVSEVITKAIVTAQGEDGETGKMIERILFYFNKGK